MKEKEQANKQFSLSWSRFHGLQWRMALSYVWTTALTALLLEVLIYIILLSFTFTIFTDLSSRAAARHPANEYAQAVTGEISGAALDPHATYAVSKPELLLQSQQKNYQDGTLVPNDLIIIPTAISKQDAAQKEVPFLLLIAPNGAIIDSSYPQQYAVGKQVTQLLPNSAQIITRALTGKPENGTGVAPLGRIAYATQTIWRNKQPIGAIYVQAPETSFGVDWLSITFFSVLFFALSLVLLLFIIGPIGGLFGLITTRGLVKRVQQLVIATTHFATGDYAQRVIVARKDEIGHLEQQFNRMAEQLISSITRQKELDEQNARLSERSRISRELHDAISQDLFSLSMLAGGLQTALPADSPLQRQMITLENTTTSMLREMRALLLELRPTQLEHLSLAESLQELANAYSIRLGITVTAAITPVILPAPAEQVLLRITQEALTNAVRHANASTITITLKPHVDTVVLSILDNGKGFDPNAREQQHGLGLRLMRERVLELNGSWQLQAAPGEGTHIQVFLPREDTYDSSLNR